MSRDRKSPAPDGLPKPFTVVALDAETRETVIDHTYGRDAGHAVLQCRAGGRPGESLVIVAVFPGHLEDAL